MINIDFDKTYSLMSDYWNRLHEKFGFKSENGLPGLLIINTTNGKKSFFDNDRIQYKPSDIGERIKSKMLLAEIMTSAPAFYDTGMNTVAIFPDRINGSLDDTLAEEVMHAAFNVPIIHLSKEQLQKISVQDDLAQMINKVVQKYKLENIRIEISEFYGAIGKFYLTGKRKEEQQAYLTLLKNNRYWWFVPLWESARDALRQFYESALKHLPEIGATELLKRYDYNIDNMLQDNPNLFKLSPQEVWDRYCIKQ